MKRIVYLTVTMILVTASLAAEKQDPLTELEAKITRSLAEDKWDYASKTFVRVLWEDYRKAHLAPDPTNG